MELMDYLALGGFVASGIGFAGLTVYLMERGEKKHKFSRDYNKDYDRVEKPEDSESRYKTDGLDNKL